MVHVVRFDRWMARIDRWKGTSRFITVGGVTNTLHGYTCPAAALTVSEGLNLAS